ncbi:MAG TPA: nitronate monooxygenase [Rubrobacter sp.]|nr:nitronate monooxygenase [Rubrobacter sp.]
MIRTGFCDVIGIEVPVVQAGMGPFGSGAELAAAVSNAGGLGTVGASGRTADDLKGQLAHVRELTDRPFAVNFAHHQRTDEGIDIALESAARVFSYAVGDPVDLVQRAQDSGKLFMQQVHTVEQAERMSDRGVDIIIAQGGEAGGFGGHISTLVLVPEVVRAVSPIPVVAAGGISHGRALAAALALGAQGANIGTRFLASVEASLADDWKKLIVAASSEDAVKVDFWWDIMPPPPDEFNVLPRALQTSFIERWIHRRDDVRSEGERIMSELGPALQQGRMHEFVPFTGQSAGAIHEILPAAEIVRRLVEDAEQALRECAELL